MHDFIAAALPNMDQSNSSESSATFTDQNSMYPRNDFPMQEGIKFQGHRQPAQTLI